MSKIIEYKVDVQYGYNPFGIDPEAPGGQVALFDPTAPIQRNAIPSTQQNAIPSTAARVEVEVDVVGVIEAADAGGDIVNAALSGGCCAIS